jgi:hypothetical protein
MYVNRVIKLVHYTVLSLTRRVLEPTIYIRVIKLVHYAVLSLTRRVLEPTIYIHVIKLVHYTVFTNLITCI